MECRRQSAMTGSPQNQLFNLFVQNGAFDREGRIIQNEVEFPALDSTSLEKISSIINEKITIQAVAPKADLTHDSFQVSLSSMFPKWHDDIDLRIKLPKIEGGFFEHKLSAYFENEKNKFLEDRTQLSQIEGGIIPQEISSDFLDKLLAEVLEDSAKNTG